MKPVLGVLIVGVSLLALANCTQTNQDAARDQTGQTPVERSVDNAAVAVDDATITTKVKTALIAEPGISGLAINVDTKDRVVTLTGQCDTQAHVDRAIVIAQSIDGVRSVTNNLTVKS